MRSGICVDGFLNIGGCDLVNRLIAVSFNAVLIEIVVFLSGLLPDRKQIERFFIKAGYFFEVADGVSAAHFKQSFVTQLACELQCLLSALKIIDFYGFSESLIVHPDTYLK